MKRSSFFITSVLVTFFLYALIAELAWPVWKSGTIYGGVYHYHTGKPIGGVSINFICSVINTTAKTFSDGAFVVTLPAPCTYTISFSKPGYKTLKMNYFLGENRIREINPVRLRSADDPYEDWLVSYGGKTTWTKINTITFHGKDLRFADFNADGKDDVFSAWGGYWYVSYGGTGKWHKIGKSGITVGGLLFGDFNGDRKADIFSTWSGEWWVSYGGAGKNGASGGWQKINKSAAKVPQLALADFNGDGKSDVFYGTGSRWLVSYGGTGTWQNLAKSSKRVGSLAFADFNRDRKADVFYGTGGRCAFRTAVRVRGKT